MNNLDMYTDALLQVVVRTCNDTTELADIVLALLVFVVVLRKAMHPMALSRRKQQMVLLLSSGRRMTQMTLILRLQKVAISRVISASYADVKVGDHVMDFCGEPKLVMQYKLSCER